MLGGRESAHSNCVQNIFGEQDSLEFNQEEVHQLTDVLQDPFEGLLRHGIVSSGTEGAGQTLRENKSSSDFKSGGHFSIVNYQASIHLSLK
jgi:hypothetical protein